MINPKVIPAGTAVVTSSLFTVPAGPATVLFANATAGGGTCFVGPGTNTTALNGFPVVSGAVPPVTVPIYNGSASQTWSALAPGGTASLVLLISSPPGGIGTGTLG